MTVWTGWSEKFLQVFRAMAGNVNAHLGHDLDGQRMNVAGRVWSRRFGR